MVGEKSAPRGGLSGAVSLARVPKDARPRSRSSQEVRLQRPWTHGSCHAAGCGRASKCRRAPGAPLGRVPEQQGPRDGPRGVLGEAGFLPLHPSHVACPDTPRRGAVAWAPGPLRPRAGGPLGAAPRSAPRAADSGQRALAPPMRQEPRVSPALEATGQDRQEKPPEELDGVQGHRTWPIAALGLLPSARHLAVVPGQQPPLGDGEPMRGAGQGAAPPRRPGPRRLGLDHPRRLLHGREALAPGPGSAPALARPLPAAAVLGGSLPQRRQAEAPAKTAEPAHREENACGPWTPGGALQGQSPCWDEAMEGGMVGQGLAPGMQAPAKADRGASGLGITGNGLQGLRHGLQQQGRDDLRMLQGEGTERGGRVQTT